MKKNEIKVLNLSNSYEYLTKGYYVSFADADEVDFPDLSNIDFHKLEKEIIINISRTKHNIRKDNYI